MVALAADVSRRGVVCLRDSVVPAPGLSRKNRLSARATPARPASPRAYHAPILTPACHYAPHLGSRAPEGQMVLAARSSGCPTRVRVASRREHLLPHCCTSPGSTPGTTRNVWALPGCRRRVGNTNASSIATPCPSRLSRCTQVSGSHAQLPAVRRAALLVSHAARGETPCSCCLPDVPAIQSDRLLFAGRSPRARSDSRRQLLW